MQAMPRVGRPIHACMQRGADRATYGAWQALACAQYMAGKHVCDETLTVVGVIVDFF